MKIRIPKTLSITLAALLLHPGMHVAASTPSSSIASTSSSGIPGAWAPLVPQDQTHWIPGTLFHGLMRKMARDEFFKQLDIVRKNNPEITDPKQIIKTVVEKMPLADRAVFGLSIQDLIDHNLAPEISTDLSGKRSLFINNMPIDDLTGLQNIRGIQNIEDLILRNNRLMSIKPENFVDLPNLKKLILNFNQLQTIVPGTFASLTNLEELNLTNNQLQAIATGTFTGLTNLKALILMHNQLQSITADAFAGLTNLNSLILSNNQLQTIAPGAFTDLTNLRYIFLENNHITDQAELDRISAELRAINPYIIIYNDNQTPAE